LQSTNHYNSIWLYDTNVQAGRVLGFYKRRSEELITVYYVQLNTFYVVSETIFPANPLTWLVQNIQPSQPITWLILTKPNISTTKNNIKNLNNQTTNYQHMHKLKANKTI